MSFVVDGSQWQFDGMTDIEITYYIERMLERVHTALDRNEVIWIGDDLQSRPVLGDLDIWSLFSPGQTLHFCHEIRHELAAWLGRAPRYADADRDEWPLGFDEFEIRVNSGLAVENADVAWAHHHVRAGRAVACLSIKQSGPQITESSHGNVTVHWVVDEVSHRAFWREAIVVEGDNETTIQRLASHAFPDLYFYEDVWGGLKDLDGSYYVLSKEIRRYLTVLDDYGKWAFTAPSPALRPEEAADREAISSPSNQLVERRFKGFSLEMAPENPNVYSDTRCRSARVKT